MAIIEQIFVDFAKKIEGSVWPANFLGVMQKSQAEILNLKNFMTKTIRIATRKSPLALWQAEHIKNRVEALDAEIKAELVTMVTEGDKILDVPLAKIGGKGLFIKELEQGMLAGKADIAVHSMKDVPMELPAGFKLAAICKRENPFDAFVSDKFDSILELPPSAVVGTSSLRRKCQILNLRPDLEIKDLRGNVNTRLRKLDAGEYDAIVLAKAGLIRLNMQNRIKSEIPADIILPAVGQGAIGIETLNEDSWITRLIAKLECPDTAARVKAERAMNHKLEGGCQVPIAGYAEINKNQIRLRALVGTVDGKHILRAEATADFSKAEDLGDSIGQELLEKGADKILKELHIS